MKDLCRSTKNYLLGKLKNDKEIVKACFFWTFFFGLLAHAFGLVNFCPSHDELCCLVNGIGIYVHFIRLGRIFQPLYELLAQAGIIFPFTNGLFAFCLIATAAVLFVKFFDVKNRYFVILTAGFFVTNRTVTAQMATYNDTLIGHMFALLFAVLAAYCWLLFTKENKKKKLLFASLFVFLSLGHYQAYIAVTITMIMMHSILSFLKTSKTQEERKVLQNGLWGILALVAGAVIYFAILKLALFATHIELYRGGYNSLQNIQDNKETLFSRLFACYKMVIYDYLLSSNYVSIFPVLFTIFVSCIFFAVGIFVFSSVCFDVAKQKKQKNVKSLSLALPIILFLLLPLGSDVTRMFNQEVHDLMVFSVWLLYLLPFLLLASCRKSYKKTSLTLAICAFLFLFNNVQTSNFAYLAKKIEYDATYSLMSDVVLKLQSLPDYKEGETPVAFLNTPSDNFSQLPRKYRIANLTGLEGNGAITYYIYGAFMKNIMNRRMNIVAEDQIEMTQEIQDMPCYPQKDSIQMIGDIAVVKFNEKPIENQKQGIQKELGLFKKILDRVLKGKTSSQD